VPYLSALEMSHYKALYKSTDTLLYFRLYTRSSVCCTVLYSLFRWSSATLPRQRLSARAKRCLRGEACWKMQRRMIREERGTGPAAGGLHLATRVLATPARAHAPSH